MELLQAIPGLIIIAIIVALVWWHKHPGVHRVVLVGALLAVLALISPKLIVWGRRKFAAAKTAATMPLDTEELPPVA